MPDALIAISEISSADRSGDSSSTGSGRTLFCESKYKPNSACTS